MTTWESPDTLNGVLEGFQLQLSSIQSVIFSNQVNVSADVQQYTWSGLHPYYFYEVRVAALTTAGKGSYTVLRIQMPQAGM